MHWLAAGALAVWVVSCWGAAEAGRRIFLADFESGPWRGEADRRAAQVDLMVSHTGLQAARLDARPDTDRHVYGPGFDLDPEKRYILTAWIKCDAVSDRRGVSLWILQWDDKQPVGWVWNWDIGQGVKELVTTGGTHSWKRFALLLQKLDPRAKRGTPYFAIARGRGVAWLDDFEIREFDGDRLPADLTTPIEEPMRPPDHPPLQPAPPRPLPPEFDLAGLQFPRRQPLGASILQNGDFEQLPPADWVQSVSLDRETRHGGQTALALAPTASGMIACSSPVDPAVDYRLSAWIKCQNVPPGGLTLRLWPGWWNETTMSEELIVSGGTQDWTRYEIVLTNLRSDLQGKVWWLYYSLAGGEVGQPTPKAWLDDVELVPLADSVRVTSARPGHIFTPADEAWLTYTVYGIPEGAMRRLVWAAADMWGNLVARGEAALVAEAGSQAQTTIPLERPGYYRFTFILQDGNGAALQAEAVSAALLPRATNEAAVRKPESIFACWGINPELAPLLGVMWTRWIERCSDFVPVEGQPQEFAWNLKQWYGDYRPREARLTEQAAGLTTYLCFGSFADWMLTGPDGTRAPVPWDWQRFADWVSFVYRQVADLVPVVEVWNEPVIPWGWQGTAEDIVTLHRVVYETVKGINPEALVLGPCDTLEHLDAFGKLGGFQWVDALSVHPYRPDSPEATDFVGELRRLRDIVGRYGPEKDIWITEMGWTTAPGYFTELEQANWIVRAYLHALREGVRNLNVHIFADWNNPSPSEKYYGIVRTDRTPKPAAVAYATMTRNLEGARFVRKLDGLHRASYGYLFERRGEPVLVLWNAGCEGMPETLSVGMEQVAVERLDGKRELVSCPGGTVTITLGQSPVFVTGMAASVRSAESLP